MSDIIRIVDMVRSSTIEQLHILSDINTHLEQIERLISNSYLSNVAAQSRIIDVPTTHARNALIHQNNATRSAQDTSNTPDTLDTPNTITRPNEIAVDVDLSSSALQSIADITEPLQSNSETNLSEPMHQSDQSDNNVRLAQSIDRVTTAADDFYEDANGRLRRANGQYATAQERDNYNSARNVADERERENQSGIIGKVIKSAMQSITSQSSDATELTGTAAGGTYFLALKEIGDLTHEMTDKIKTRFSRRNNQNSELASARLARERAELLQEQTDQQAIDARETHQRLDELIAAVEQSESSDGDIDLSAIGDARDLIESMRGQRSRNTQRSRGGRMSSIYERASSASAGLGRNIMRGAGPVAALMAGIDKLMDVQGRTELTVGQKTAQVGSTASGALVGTGGGAALGALIGSIVPGLGTALGGMIGAALGGGLGTSLGSDIGESISDFLGSDQSLGQYITNIWHNASSSADDLMDRAENGASEIAQSAHAMMDDVWQSATHFFDDDTQTQPVIATQTIQTNNQSIEQIKNTQNLQQTDKKLQVDLDHTALTKAFSDALQKQPQNATNVTVHASQVGAATGIPDDFTTRDLRRQSADI